MIGFILWLITGIFFQGIIQRVKSITSGRKGPGMIQHIHDILRLLKKETTYPKNVSFIYKIAPVVHLACLITAAMVIPFQSMPALIGFDGDFIFFASVLGLSRLFMVLAALDTGSAFEGMGANRDALYGMLIEPAFLILMGSFAMVTGQNSIYYMFDNFVDFYNQTVIFLLILSVLILYNIMIIENGRIPIDDPKTHLELTMIHEVMVLDYTGVDLAIIQIGSGLKFALYAMLISNLILPSDISLPLQICSTLAIHFALAFIVGLQESFQARERLKKNPTRIFTVVIMSLIVFIGVLLMMNKV